MENKFLSLLYPDAASEEAHRVGGARPNISASVCDEIGLSDMLGLKNSSVTDYFTSDERVIRFRQETMADMLEIPELGATLSRVLPVLFDITELRGMDFDSGDHTGDSYLYSITEIELYISCIDVLHRGLSEVGDRIKSEAFGRLRNCIAELAESEYYRDLNEKLTKLSSRIREVRSITVGVNLDAQLRPKDAGIISINSETFKSGELLDKILRLSFKNDSFTCIASLVPFGKGQNENRREALVHAFNSAINDVFRSSVKSWRNIIGEYVLDNTDFLLKILPEIEFLNKASSMMARLRDRGCDICLPRIMPASDKAFDCLELYNPSVALQIDDEIVSNDFKFDDEGRIFVLTGPNRGGKSVITCAVGLAQSMAQLGLYLPAKTAEISPVDGIFTHFPEGADDTLDKGRLGEECARLREIFDSITPDSMILLDESLSSTGAYEAAYIAAEILAGFGTVGCRGIFSTHLHDLAAAIDSINERSASHGGVKIDTLVAGIYEGKRSFKIERAKPDGKSYARDITDKYGLSFDSIIKNKSNSAN